MGVRTRSATSSPVKKTTPLTSGPPVQPQQNDPVRLIILPENLSPQARILLLPYPRDQTVRRFLFCPVRGLFDFTKVSSPLDPRSVLFCPEPSDAAEDGDTSLRFSDGYISKDAELFIATMFDPTFFLLPLLPSQMNGSTKPLFQPLDDLLESHMEKHKHIRYVMRHGRHMLENTMASFCDNIEAGDENMYRVNEAKTLDMILKKAECAVESGLPSSLEEKFVTRALEAPVLSIKREESTVGVLAADQQAGDADASSDSFDSQSTKASSEVSAVFSEVSVTSSISTITPDSVSPNIIQLQRLRTAINFIMASYLPQPIANHLQSALSSTESRISFAPLDDHLKLLASLRAEAMASRSIGDFNRKRTHEDDDDAAELRAEKKRKVEEEEKKRKAGESRGVRDLKKVNVTGMKKMSAFFSKQPAAAKAKS